MLDDFVAIDECVYKPGALKAFAQDESMPCDCVYYEGTDPPEKACGEGSGCINRLLFIECINGSCPCRDSCLNRRFQLRQFAQVSVFAAGGKGRGLMLAHDLDADQLVIEYVGEVINHKEYLRRSDMVQKEGNEHLYFMTLNADTIIDASKKGNIARFINHSCNPNCHTEKWVVGNKTRIGIFTSKALKAGTELTFDYKFERYGAQPQKCLCGEPNCKGTIGLLKQASSKAAVPAKQESDYEEEEDADFVEEDNGHFKSLSSVEDLIPLVKKLVIEKNNEAQVLRKLVYLENTDDSAILKKFLDYHGQRLLKTVLKTHKDSSHVAGKVLKILLKLPINTRNLIEELNIDPLITDTMERFTEFKDLCNELLDKWKSLPSVYKIPKAKVSDSNLKQDQQSESWGKIQQPQRPPQQKPLPIQASFEKKRKYSEESARTDDFTRRPSASPSPSPSEPIKKNTILIEGVEADMLQKVIERAIQGKKGDTRDDLKQMIYDTVMESTGKYKKLIPSEDLKKHSKKLYNSIVDKEIKRQESKGITEFTFDDAIARMIKKHVTEYFKNLGFILSSNNKS